MLYCLDPRSDDAPSSKFTCVSVVQDVGKVWNLQPDVCWDGCQNMDESSPIYQCLTERLGVFHILWNLFHFHKDWRE